MIAKPIGGNGSGGIVIGTPDELVIKVDSNETYILEPFIEFIRNNQRCLGRIKFCAYVDNNGDFQLTIEQAAWYFTDPKIKVVNNHTRENMIDLTSAELKAITLNLKERFEPFVKQLIRYSKASLSEILTLESDAEIRSQIENYLKNHPLSSMYTDSLSNMAVPYHRETTLLRNHYSNRVVRPYLKQRLNYLGSTQEDNIICTLLKKFTHHAYDNELDTAQVKQYRQILEKTLRMGLMSTNSTLALQIIQYHLNELCLMVKTQPLDTQRLHMNMIILDAYFLLGSKNA